MGLDAYLMTGGKGKESIEVMYWRKFGELQNLIASMACDRGLVDRMSDFNCVDFYLTEEDIDVIIDALESKVLPDHSGFFFGGSNKDDDEYINDAIGVFKKAKELIRLGERIYYTSWW